MKASPQQMRAWQAQHEASKEADAAHNAAIWADERLCVCGRSVDKVAEMVFVAGPNGPLHVNCAPDPITLRAGQGALL